MARTSEGDLPFDLNTIVDRRYLISAIKARTAACAVYRAEHIHLGCQVAIKAPLNARPRQQRHIETIHRFLSLAAASFAASQLHSGIVKVLDAGISADTNGPGIPYLAMEWWDAMTLHDHLHSRTGRSTKVTRPHSVINLLGFAVKGLAAAHRHGLVHGDLKPSNILLTREARFMRARLIDFSVPQVETLSSGARTPAYAAPEQWLPKYGPIGPATDVHALGLICFELLLGTRFFPMQGVEPLKAACLNATVRHNRLAHARIPYRLKHALASALSVVPSERPPHADAFWKLLTQAVTACRS